MSNRMYRRPKSGYSKPPKTKLNKVLSDVKKLKKAVPKANDPNITFLSHDATVTDAGSITSLALGTLEAQEDESNIRVVRMAGRILVTHNPAATALKSFYTRIILFRDLQTNAAAPTVDDVLRNVEPHSLYDPITRRRYKILMDRTVRTSGIDQSGNVIVFNKKLNFLQSYDDASNCTKNNIYLLVLGDEATNGADFKSNYEFHSYQ